MKSLRLSFTAFAAVFALSVAALAADASGTWKWSSPARGSGGGGAPRENTLTLVSKDGKLTGKLSTPGRGGEATSTEIKDASIKDDVVSFTVERTYNDTKVVQKYSGKLSGDVITGTREGPGRDGQTSKQEWVAKRAK